MSRLFSIYLLILCLARALAMAQDTPAPSSEPAAAPSASAPTPFLAPPPAAPPAPPPPPAAPPHDPNQSAGVSAMLAAGMPKYDPPKAAPPPKPDDQLVDLRDVDKPKNKIIRLPKYVVHAEKPPIFREKDLYSTDGLARLAMLRYQGLNLGPGSYLNQDIAAELYREDDRLKSISDLNDTAAAMQRGGDANEASFIRDAAQSTYQQSLDWGGPVPHVSSSGSSGEPGTPP